MTEDARHSILPTEHIAPSSRWGIALTVIVVLTSGVFMNLLVKRVLSSHPGMDNPSYAAFDAQWQRLDSLEEGLDTLILGDSSGRHGLNPEEFDDVTGGRSLNFCTMGNAAVINAAWQLEAYLRRWPAPRRVLLTIVHDVWPRTLSPQLAGRVPLGWGFWHDLRAKENYAEGDRWTVFENRYLPLMSQHQTLSELALYPWKIGERRIEFNASGFGPIWRPRPENVADDRHWQIKALANQTWAASDQSRRSLAAMMSLAEEYGFDIYVALSPMNRELYEDEGFQQYYTSYLDGLRRLIGDSPRAHLLSDAPALYEDGEMQNTDHIARDMTTGYTRLVAEQVLQVESRARR